MRRENSQETGEKVCQLTTNCECHDLNSGVYPVHYDSQIQVACPYRSLFANSEVISITTEYFNIHVWYVVYINVLL